jgi:MFS family permease
MPSAADRPLPRRAGGGPLRSNPAFRILFTAKSVSAFGDSLTLVALLLLLQGQLGQSFAVAALLLVGDFAPSLLGPLSGAISDRFDRRTVVIGCELVRALTVGTIAATLPALPVLLVLVGVSAVAGQVLQSAVRGGVPLVVADAQLQRANSALGFASNGMEAAGPFVAGVLLTFTTTPVVLAVDAATSLAAAVLLVRLPRLRPERTEQNRAGMLVEAGAGVRFLWSTPLLRVVTLGFVGVVVCNGVDDVALVFLATGPLAAGGFAAGALYAAVGVGLLIGYVLLGRRGSSPALPMLVVAGCTLNSLGNALTGLAWSVAAAFALQLMRGLGISALDVGVTTLMQRVVPPGMLGTAFGTLYGAVGMAAAASYLLGALALELTGPRVTFLIAGTAGVVVSAATAAAFMRIRGPDPVTRP